MKVFILVDKDSIVRCMASEECNLHKNKLHMSKYYVEPGNGTVGDKYFSATDIWEKHPENYPQPSETEINEAKINAKIRKLAIEALIAEGELPPDYQAIGGK